MANSFQSAATLCPEAAYAALLMSNMIPNVAMLSTAVTSGTITSGMLAFESTVLTSDTGKDFQKRMLRSRRSA